MIKALFYNKHSDAIRYYVTFDENMNIKKVTEECITNTGDVKKIVYPEYEFENIKEIMNPIWIDRIEEVLTAGKKSITLNTVQSIKWSETIKEAKTKYENLIKENINNIKTSYDLHLLRLIKCNIENNNSYDNNIKKLLDFRIETITNCITNNQIPQLVC
jgi:hypothetical protein